jgi:hypothetical protein
MREKSQLACRFSAETQGRHIHESTFRSELAQFQTFQEAGLSLFVDPAWLAILIAILIVASLTPDGTAPGSPSTPSANPESGALDRAFESILLCAGSTARPQFRIIQAILILFTT